MSIRDLAREQAEAIYAEAIKGLFGMIERRIEWRRANAQQLALEAERMIVLLASDPRRVFFRKWRIGHWRRVQRKHAARAWATNRMLTMACRICPPGGGAYA